MTLLEFGRDGLLVCPVMVSASLACTAASRAIKTLSLNNINKEDKILAALHLRRLLQLSCCILLACPHSWAAPTFRDQASQAASKREAAQAKAQSVSIDPIEEASLQTKQTARQENLAAHKPEQPHTGSLRDAESKERRSTAGGVGTSAVSMLPQDGTADSTTAEEPQRDPSKEHWRSAAASSTNGKSKALQLELVVCRYTENLEWISSVPYFWRVTILNRGKRENWLAKPPRGRRWAVTKLRSVASDSEAFASFLVSRYDSLAEYTVFSPAAPLRINGWFLHLLNHPAKLGSVQALSGVMSKNGTWTMTERISTRTLNSVLIHHPESVNVAKWFSKDYNLTWGTNLLRKYFDLIGLPHWMDERMEVGSYAPGGMLGFERSRATRHHKPVYEALLSSCKVFGGNHLVVERMWVMLFAGTDFRDNPIHHAL